LIHSFTEVQIDSTGMTFTDVCIWKFGGPSSARPRPRTRCRDRDQGQVL